MIDSQEYGEKRKIVIVFHIPTLIKEVRVGRLIVLKLIQSRPFYVV
jgi:hypothetical protein